MMAKTATIPFEVRNRWTGGVQFTAQIACSPDELASVKLGLAVKWAVEEGANLGDANLGGANLLAMGDGRFLKTLQLERWNVGYTADTMQIGCQRHPLADWWAFDDACIAAMDSHALEWRGWWKPILQQIVEMSPADPTGYVPPAEADAA